MKKLVFCSAIVCSSVIGFEAVHAATVLVAAPPLASDATPNASSNSSIRELGSFSEGDVALSATTSAVDLERLNTSAEVTTDLTTGTVRAFAKAEASTTVPSTITSKTTAFVQGVLYDFIAVDQTTNVTLEWAVDGFLTPNGPNSSLALDAQLRLFDVTGLSVVFTPFGDNILLSSDLFGTEIAADVFGADIRGSSAAREALPVVPTLFRDDADGEKIGIDERLTVSAVLEPNRWYLTFGALTLVSNTGEAVGASTTADFLSTAQLSVIDTGGANVGSLSGTLPGTSNAVAVAPIPIPSSFPLLLAGGAALVMLKRRKARAA